MDLNAEFIELSNTILAAARHLRLLLLDKELPAILLTNATNSGRPEPHNHSLNQLHTLDAILKTLLFVHAQLAAFTIAPPPPDPETPTT